MLTVAFVVVATVPWLLPFSLAQAQPACKTPVPPGGVVSQYDAFKVVSYCTGQNALAIVAHADDDFYFVADQIKPIIAAGHCFKVVHLTGGYADKSGYYQTRVNAALAGYERMLGLPSPTTWTSTWDPVNGKLVLRYQTVLRWTATGPQTLEVQVVGLPCGFHDHGDSYQGVTLAALFNDARAHTTTIDGKGTSYNLAEVRAFLEQIFTWALPSTIFTLDPYGSFFSNGHEGQHPDHIVTARLVQESAYVASHPTVVKYFKTYNLNNLPVNLGSDGIIAKNEAMLGYVSVDPGTWTLGEGAKDCSGLSISDQLGDYGWLCKDYAAQDGTYFQAAQLKLVDGRCLAVRKSDGKVTFATCTDTAYATDFSLDGQGQVFVGNATRRRLRTDLSAGSTVTAPKWDETPTDGHVSEWRYNPTSKTLQQTNPSNAQLICVAPGTPGGTDVFMFDCGSGAALTVTRGAAAPTGVPLTFKNKVTGRCVRLSQAGAVSIGDCASSDARLKLNAAGQLASAANPNQCLQRQKFQQRSPYVGAPCNSASFGQRFALTRVASGTDYTFVSHSPASCMEDYEDGLSGLECHNYEQQLWVVTDDCDAEPTGPTFLSIDCRLAALRDRVAGDPRLGDYQQTLLPPLEDAAARLDQAVQSCVAVDVKRAKTRLKRAGQRVDDYDRRLRNLNARKKLRDYAALREEYLAAGRAILTDVRGLRGGLRCPEDAGVVN